MNETSGHTNNMKRAQEKSNFVICLREWPTKVDDTDIGTKNLENFSIHLQAFPNIDDENEEQTKKLSLIDFQTKIAEKMQERK